MGGLAAVLLLRSREAPGLHAIAAFTVDPVTGRIGALEALARGTPVISSGLGALSEVTGTAALEPERDDPASWAEAIERVIHDAAVWQELSDAGQRRSRDFTWDAAAEATRPGRGSAGSATAKRTLARSTTHTSRSGKLGHTATGTPPP